METRRRGRPTLQPIWTDYYNLKGHPKSAFRVAYSPMFSASPGSPRVFPPSPMYPPSYGYDPTIRRRERTMVDYLDQRPQPAPGAPDGQPRPLPSIAEQSPSAASDSSTQQPSPATPYASRDLLQVPRRPTIADETRSLLLSHVPLPHLRDVGNPMDRRRSLPSLPTTPAFSRRRGSHMMREHLQAWGHVYLSDENSADCFVVAVALRRPSEASGDEDDAKHEKGSATLAKSSRRTIRARIRPRAPERKPFILQRTFDLDELRATIPEPSPTAVGSSSGARRLSADMSPMQARSGGRKMSSPSNGPGSPALVSARKSPVLDVKTVPIHLQYARVHLPVLAAVMLSGHVREGDIIDLPMPYPEVWGRTVAYVYTGVGELTEAMKENILYLAGKV